MTGAPLRYVALLVLLMASSGSAAAQPLPTLDGAVTDVAGIIDARSAAELAERIRALRDATGDVIFVATVDSVAPYGTIEEYAVRLFAESDIDDRARDRGLLVLVAVAERRVRIEMGYGLEEVITDRYAGEVIRNDMLPAFRSGEYGPGLLAGVTSLVRHISERRHITVAGLPALPVARGPEGPPVLRTVLIVLVLLALASIGSTRGRGPGIRRRGRHWHGGIGGFGGGFSGFGGGMSGGFGSGRGSGQGGGVGAS